MNDKRVNDLGDYSDICAFVPQNDIMLPNFTVFELLFFYARLKLPRKTTNRECFVMAQEVINCLGLAHIRHSIIGDASRRGISGGQKKRVNVAMEMVGDPSLIFLDEPTSGLDSTTSNDVLNALKVMSRSNVNVILVRSSIVARGVGENTQSVGENTHSVGENTQSVGENTQSVGENPQSVQ